MSTATIVPSVHGAQADDAVRTLRTTGWRRLLRESLARFFAADGFSHCRALAFQMTLTALPAVIAGVGLATTLDQRGIRSIFRETLLTLSPGKADDTVAQAFKQGSEANGGDLALWFGLLVALVSATAAMGQMERAMNRIYGIDRDRQFVTKYLRGFVLAISAGILLMAAFVLFIAGSAIREAGLADAGWGDAAASAWSVLRWPTVLVLLAGAFALLFRHVPYRRQPSASWLAVGSALSLVLWLLFTGLLALYIEASKEFDEIYGPLAGMIGLLVWAYLSSIAILVGVAFTAQLEAVRSQTPPTSDPPPS